ncbi:MAG TPA: hypothetical protein VGF15_01325 [Solirubrobacteraceae bacterium]
MNHTLRAMVCHGRVQAVRVGQVGHDGTSSSRRRVCPAHQRTDLVRAPQQLRAQLLADESAGAGY